MATRFQKILWSLLCGTALGMGACGEGTEPLYGAPEYGPPMDTATDEEADVEDGGVDPEEEEPTMTDYGPPTP